MARRTRWVMNRTVARTRVKAVAVAGMTYVAREAEDILVETLTPPPEPTGEVYASGRVAPHRASAPGEPPARDTGELAQSIVSDLDINGLRVRASIGTPLPKGAFLHFGTERIEPRPWITALKSTTSRFALKDAFRDGAATVL